MPFDMMFVFLPIIIYTLYVLYSTSIGYFFSHEKLKPHTQLTHAVAVTLKNANRKSFKLC